MLKANTQTERYRTKHEVSNCGIGDNEQRHTIHFWMSIASYSANIKRTHSIHALTHSLSFALSILVAKIENAELGWK